MPEWTFVPLKTYLLIIGAMKCGTTSLFSLLSQHPQIAASRIKEVNFFSFNSHWAKGIDWYESLFPYDANQHQYCLEASVSYTKLHLYPNVPNRMASLGLPYRFIYLVRDPIERIESHYTHGLADDWPISHSEALVDDHAILTTNYLSQIRPYIAEFGRENILALNLQQVIDQPVGTLEEIQNFLGIDRFSISEELPTENRSKDKHIPTRTSKVSLRANQVLRKVGLRLPQSLRYWLATKLMKPVNRVTLNSEQKRYVLDRLGPDLKEFTQIFPGVLE